MLNIKNLQHEIIVFVFALILGIIFYSFPQIDIKFSALFYKSSEGFFLDMNPVVKIIHRAVPVVSCIFVIVALVLGLKTLYHKKSIKPKHYIKIIYVTLVCLLGPGLIVHNVIKDNINRARPNEVVEFGGQKKFTAAFQVSDQCASNCSFVSGHASVGFMFFSLAFLMQGRRRTIMMIASVVLGLVIGLGRVMEGDHFLSDVLFAGVVVYLVAYYLEKVLKPNSTK